MCYLIARERDGHGCYALKTKLGKHLAEMMTELNAAVGFSGIELTVISRPMAYYEYAPYQFVDTEEEFKAIVKAMRPQV